MIVRTISVILIGLASVTAKPAGAQNMCVECDVLVEKLEILRAKEQVLWEGLELMLQAQNSFSSNRTASDAIAASYLILQGLNISFGLATLPCSVPVQWLRGVIAGSGSLGAYIQDGSVGSATLSGVVSYVGGGVVSDFASTAEFMREYSASQEGMRQLNQHLGRTISEFNSALERILDEAIQIERDLVLGGCEVETYHDLVESLFQ